MPYSSAQARQELLDALAVAADRLAGSLGLLSAAYELLDDNTAELLEERLFGPVQHAYGRLRRTYTGFADGQDLSVRDFAPGAQGAPSRGVQGLIESAVAEAQAADLELATLQDSMMPVEVGDIELRAGLEEVRTLLAGVPAGSRDLLRGFGR